MAACDNLANSNWVLGGTRIEIKLELNNFYYLAGPGPRCVGKSNGLRRSDNLFLIHTNRSFSSKYSCNASNILPNIRFVSDLLFQTYTFEQSRQNFTDEMVQSSLIG